MQSNLERTFETLWRQAIGKDAPRLAKEYLFFPGRKWRFDFAHIESKVAVECEGGIHAPRSKCCPTCGQPPRSRHTTGKGFTADIEKYNTATANGWRVFRVTAEILKNSPVGFIFMVDRVIKLTRVIDTIEITQGEKP